MNAEYKPTADEIREAKINPNGWVYRIKGEYDPNGRVPPEAILGAWKVSDEGIIIGDFIINEVISSADRNSRT